MVVHIVEPNDTISSISRKYNITPQRLELDNDLYPGYSLTVGQALMISNPEKTYITKTGDTYTSVSEEHGISLKQLLRNNPHLSLRTNFFPGEEIIINHKNNANLLKVNGYTNTFINREVLIKTLPYLTYITIYNFRATATGDFMDLNDAEILTLAKNFDVKPIMFLSAITEQGKGSYGVVHGILSNKQVQRILIDKTLIKLKLSGYYGLNIGLLNVLDTDMQNYVDFIEYTTTRLNSEGFLVFVNLTPFTMKYSPVPDYESPYFARIGQVANYVNLMTYLWSTAEISQVAETTADYLKIYLNYALTQIPPEKIFLGLARIAYDWELPYVPLDNISSSLSNTSAIRLANQRNVPIQFDNVTQTPYFYYIDEGVQHYVWFKDARSVIAIINLIEEYGLRGLAVWNIMYFTQQTWLPIISEYDIETLP